MRPLDRFARVLALTNPALLVYSPDVLRYGPDVLAVYDPAKTVVAGLGTLVAVAFHVYDCRKRAQAAAAELDRAKCDERTAIARAAQSLRLPAVVRLERGDRSGD
jgi:hypothetical protein